MTKFTESIVEEAALAYFADLGYETLYGPDLAPGEPAAERQSYDEVLLTGPLRSALARLNPHIPAATLEEVILRLRRTESPSLIENNRLFHRLLVDGVDVSYRASDGSTTHDKVWLLDFTNHSNNRFQAINQFTIIENKHQRRPDIIVFVNGLPLAVFELKNAADEKADIKAAFHQLQTYKTDIPVLFPYNQLLVISDGILAKLGTLTADKERFMPWRTIHGDVEAAATLPQLEVLIKGVFEPARFLELIRYFIVFETDGVKLVKKIAGYHQFHAVNKAVENTVRASAATGDRRVGVVWHTQGSGKSLSMAFYAGKIAQHPAMQNPTLIVLTDRNDLDDQLFGTFSACRDLLRQAPTQAENRDDLREKLKVASGGIVFTTIQKFMPDAKGERYPLLSQRRNIVFIADEAHRSQYDFIDGFARHVRDALPNASFIGFTGTPIEANDKNTQAVFGDYIDVYDIQRSVEDGATVRIYYEARLAKLQLKEAARPHLDPDFEEATEGEEVAKKEKLKSKWARLEAVVGSEDRINQVADDIVAHFEQRLSTLEGKAMIVCMSRRICVDLYAALEKLRPAWPNPADDKGFLKVVMTGSASDPAEYQPHIRSKSRREALAHRLKDPNDELKLVIVRDMWLTGFDAPSLHTMYADKPMQGHGLMQAIARVNRVFKDKPGGLIVDYLGLADRLKEALAAYTERDRTQAGIPQELAVHLFQEKYEVTKTLFHGFDYSPFWTGTPQQRLSTISWGMNHILTLPDGKKRFMHVVLELSRTFVLCVTSDLALTLRDEIAYFQAVRTSFIKITVSEGNDEDDIDSAIRQLISRAVSSGGVIDLFSAAGLKRPDISILSEEFLAEVKDLPQKNVALELLRKLLNDEIKTRSTQNVVQARSFQQILEQAILRYHNRAVEVAEIIDELIQLARDMKAAVNRGEQLGLSDDELAFYDALETSESSVAVLGDNTLKIIARELVEAIRKSVTIDWTVKESVRAELRVKIKRLLNKYGYPPDKRERATATVLLQAETICRDWAIAA